MWSKLILLLDEHKNDDSIIMLVIKLVYSVVTTDWIQPFLNLIFSVAISIIIGVNSDCYVQWWFIALCFIVLVENIGYGFCISYSHREFAKHRLCKKILKNIDLIINSIGIWVSGYNNNGWKNKIFKQVCALVSESIYSTFKEIFQADIRVSVEYQFEKNGVTCIKMLSRKSSSRFVTDNPSYILSQKTHFYSGKVFANNQCGVHFLNNGDFATDKWFKNSTHTLQIKQYLAIAGTANKQHVAFILQIDSIDKNIFGSGKADAELFADIYLKPYANLILTAYIINRNKDGVVPEV